MAVKDNRIDSQLWPTEVIEGVNQAWLKRVFSRPGPQEPEERLPDLTEENPIQPIDVEELRTRMVSKRSRFNHRGV